VKKKTRKKPELKTLSFFSKPSFLFIAIPVIFLLGFLPYINTLDNPFIWDDVYLIKDNPILSDFKNIPQLFVKNIGGDTYTFAFYRPLQPLTYMIDQVFYDLDARGYHVTNILIHIFVALSLFFLITTIFKDRWMALLASLLFVVHPLHTEAVTYISGRADLLVALFILLTFIYYVRFLDSRDEFNYGFSLFFFFLALLSKEYALIVPFLFGVYHFSLNKALPIARLSVFIIIGGAYAFLRQWEILGEIITYEDVHTTLAERIPGVFVAITDYLRLLVWPTDLHMGYGLKLFDALDPRAILGVALLVGMIYVILRKRKKEPLLCFSVAWFLVGLFPVLNIYPINAYFAEHWVNIPNNPESSFTFSNCPSLT